MLSSLCLNKITPVGFIGAFQFSSELHSVRLYQSAGGFHVFVMVAEIMYMLFILYYMFLQVNINVTSKEYGSSPLNSLVLCYPPESRYLIRLAGVTEGFTNPDSHEPCHPGFEGNMPLACQTYFFRKSDCLLLWLEAINLKVDLLMRLLCSKCACGFRVIKLRNWFVSTCKNNFWLKAPCYAPPFTFPVIFHLNELK